MRHPFRILIGCVVVAVASWAVTPAPIVTAADAAPDLGKDAYKKAAEADLKFLQERVSDLNKKQAAGTKLLDGQIKPALGVSLLLSVYGDALGDKALKDDAIKVAEAIVKKDFKAADAMAAKLAVKPGKAGKPGALPKPFKSEAMLEAVMQPFRGSSVGGMNIDRDIKDMTKSTNPTKIDPAVVELIGVRSAIISAYAAEHPNATASVNEGNMKLWAKYSKDSVDLGKRIAAEAAKAKPNEMKLKTDLSNLMTQCNDCHEKFRDN